MGGSKEPKGSPELTGGENTGIPSIVALPGGSNNIISMSIHIGAGPQAVQALQVPPAPQLEIPSSSAHSSRRPSQVISRGNELGSEEGFPPPLRRVTTLATDDQLHALKEYDTQFLIDDSGSMRLSTSKISKGKTHWEEVNQVLSDIVGICAEFDENGVDVFFFNSSLVGQFNRTNIKNPDEVMKLFEDRYQAGIRGSTPTAEALDLIIAPYLKECERCHIEDRKFPKPKNIIVMTDGAANNNKLLRQNLISYAKKLDKIDAPLNQIGVQFFQVGNVEGVEEFLIYLDNALSEDNECRDFIDTKSSEDMGPEGLTARRVLTTVLGGVSRRFDNAMT